MSIRPVPAFHRFPLNSFLFAAALPAAFAHAVETTPVPADGELPTVTVTAAADPVATTVPDLTAAHAAQREVPGGAAVVVAEEFRDGRVATPEDALRFAPGVFAASRFGSEESRLSIRGSGLQRTFHGRGLLLLQDGVPLNLADGSFDFQAVEPLAVQYITVNRGANAFAQGATTLGGAIDFVSATGLDAGPQVRLEGGSFGHRRAYAQYGAGGERGDGFVSVSHYGRDGFQAHAEQDTQRLFANAGHRVSDTLEQRVFLTLVQTESELPGSLTEAELRSGQLRRAAPANLTGDQRRDFDLARLAWTLNWQPVPAQTLGASAYYSDKSLFHPIFQVLQQDSADYGGDLRWQHRAPFGRDGDRARLGLRLQHGRIDDDRFANVGGLPQARTDQSRQRAENHTLYAQYDAALAADWMVIAGLQWVSARRELDDRFFAPPADPDKSFGKRYEQAVPRLGLLHALGERTQVFANVSGVFEPPSFGELAGGPGVDLLAAQEGVSLELGTRGDFAGSDQGGWDLVLYRVHLENELIAFQVAPSATRTVNAGRTVHQGVEAGVALAFREDWRVRLAWQFSDFRFDDDATYGDNAIAGVPAQVLNAELRRDFRAPRLYVAATLGAASSSWVDHLNRVQAPGYAVLGLKLGQELTPAWSWFLEGRNLADEDYAATHGVVVDATQLAAGQPQRLFNPGDGRAVYAGLSWKMP